MKKIVLVFLGIGIAALLSCGESKPEVNTDQLMEETLQSKATVDSLNMEIETIEATKDEIEAINNELENI